MATRVRGNRVLPAVFSRSVLLNYNRSREGKALHLLWNVLHCNFARIFFFLAENCSDVGECTNLCTHLDLYRSVCSGLDLNSTHSVTMVPTSGDLDQIAIRLHISLSPQLASQLCV